MPSSVFLEDTQFALPGQAAGDLFYADSANTITRLADVATGSVLVSGGVGAAPAWSASPTVTKIIVGDGTASAPSITFANDTDLGWYRQSADDMVAVGSTGTKIVQIRAVSGLLVNQTLPIAWGDIGVAADLFMFRDAANILAQRNGTNAQEHRTYGYYASASGFTTGVVKAATGAVTLSGATTATSNIIPVGSFVIGVATTTTTTITGASGYQVGDGSDADRWGDITGTAVGTDSDNTDSTANPTGYFAAASAVTLTAKTSNFTGGVVQVTVFYLTTGAD